MPRYVILILILANSYFPVTAQQYLELIETSVKPEIIGPYINSYLQFRELWLLNGKLPDTLNGGNALSPETSLNAQRLDSIRGVSALYLPPGLVKSGKLIPRIRYNKIEDTHAYFLTTVYEAGADSNRVVVQFKILFDTTVHNQMPDIFDVSVVNPEVVLKHAPELIKEELLRALRKEELGLVP